MGFHFHHKASRASDAALERQIRQATLPLLVEFAEKDSPPCRMEAHVLDQVLRTHADRLGVLQADVQSAPEMAARYEVTAVPTLLLFVDGQPRLRLVGFKTADEIRTAVEHALAELATSPPPSGTGAPA